MKAVILNVGNEVLSGKVVNTNSSYLAMELAKLGLDVVKTIVVGDDKEMLINEINQFKLSKYDILITTGGLGPTHDDFTKEVVCDALNKPLVLREEAKALLDKYFNGDYAKCNIKQAYFPSDAILLNNEVGTADGAIIESENKKYIILVGPPFELKPMFKNQVVPYLLSVQTELPLVSEYIVMGIGESKTEDMLVDFAKLYPNIELAPYASLGKIRYQITANPQIIQEYTEANAYFCNLLSEYIISDKNESIEELVVGKLRQLNYHISMAESCTGGMIASTIISINGASSVINESLITYSNESKMKYLGVKHETITKHDVVSKEVVYEMAQGLKMLTNSEVNIAVSGIAGPTGGTDEKPVGLVWYAINIDDAIICESQVFHGDREQIRIRATRFILYRLYKILVNNK